MARLKRGEDVAGGTGRQLSDKGMVAIIGSPAAARRALKVATIYRAGAEKEMLDEKMKRKARVENRVINEFYRKIPSL